MEANNTASRVKNQLCSVTCDMSQNNCSVTSNQRFTWSSDKSFITLLKSHKLDDLLNSVRLSLARFFRQSKLKLFSTLSLSFSGLTIFNSYRIEKFLPLTEEINVLRLLRHQRKRRSVEYKLKFLKYLL